MTGLLQEGSGVFAIVFIVFLFGWRLFPLVIARFRGNKEQELYARVTAALDRNTEAVSELTRLLQEMKPDNGATAEMVDAPGELETSGLNGTPAAASEQTTTRV